MKILGLFFKTAILIIVTVQFSGCKPEGSPSSSEGQKTASSENSNIQSQDPSANNAQQGIENSPQFAIMAERIFKANIRAGSGSYTFKRSTFVAEGLMVTIQSITEEKINLKWNMENKITINGIEVGKMDDYIGGLVQSLNNNSTLISKAKADIKETEDINATYSKFE